MHVLFTASSRGRGLNTYLSNKEIKESLQRNNYDCIVLCASICELTHKERHRGGIEEIYTLSADRVQEVKETLKDMQEGFSRSAKVKIVK